jgi:putative Mg2+ transporter-C (MgtC) family protein
MSGAERLLDELGLPQAWASALALGTLLRLLLAALLGGVVGLQRELTGRPVGLRASLLVCMGAALVTELSWRLASPPAAGPMAAGADPSHLAAQVVTALGLLGAALIVQARGQGDGLVAAATLWTVGGIGMAVGARAYAAAAGAAVLVLGVLLALGRLEGVLLRRRTVHRYHFYLDADPALLESIHRGFREAGLEVESETVEKDPTGFRATFTVFGPAFLHRELARGAVARTGVHRMSRSG